MYIVLKDAIQIAGAETKAGLLPYFNFAIRDGGHIRFNDETDTISYSMDKMTRKEVQSDFVRTRMIELLKRDGYVIAKTI